MKDDFFADLATRPVDARRGQLEEVRPPRLARRQFPTAKSDPAAAFWPAAKLGTAEELAAELARQRRRYAPFLRNLAPPLRSPRISRRLEKFQWRLETAEDRADFSRPMRGGGRWERVKTPHFGGPIGRAVAFYRATFEVSAAMLQKGAVYVRFGAADYKAHVFVNGHYLGSHEGFFASFEFECAARLRQGANTLLVKLENDAIFMSNRSWGLDEEGDKLYAATGLGWEDPDLGWHHCPPGFGLCQKVWIEARAPMHIADVWVRPLAEPGLAEAWIEVGSQDRKRRSLAFEISVFGQNFRQTVVRGLRDTPATRMVPGLGDLQQPTDNQEVTLMAGPGLNRFKVLVAIPKPRLWDLETPWLYQIQVRLLDEAGAELDNAQRQFGLRHFRMDTARVPRGRLWLNGREIKLRGANTMGFEQQDVLKEDFAQLVDDILLAKIGHLNFWRLTQRPVQPEVYDYADRLGLLTQTDLPLFGCLRYSQFAEAVRQAEEMERLVRSHPCNILLSYINEPFPNAAGKPHRHLTRVELEGFFEAADRAVRVANPDRVIKHADGDYDPPGTGLPDNHCYSAWYNGHGLDLGKLHKGYWIPVKPDWSYGCGEFGAEGLDFVELMKRRYPRPWLPAPDNEAEWSPGAIVQAQSGKFHYLWFDRQHTLEDWVRTSQQFQAWATRLFTERFRRDNRMVSFAIHLFIDAFPSGWMKTIVDCERRPKPAYFAYREALTPLMVTIRTDRWAFTSGEKMPFEFWVCNDTATAGKGFELHWQIEEGGRVVFAQQSRARVHAMQSVFQGFFSPPAPPVQSRGRYTLRLALAEGKRLLHDTAVEYEVFPDLGSPGQVAVIAMGTGKAQRLLAELRVKPAEGQPKVILVDSFSDYARRRRSLEREVSAGARLVFLELPPGEYAIAGSGVRVEECSMRPRHFVSRATGHPLVAGFAPEDFKCWFEPAAGHITPLLASVFEGAGWRPILGSGNARADGAWEPRLAAAERRSGKGAYVICQIALAGRTRHNPAAQRFARRLIGLDAEAEACPAAQPL